MIKSKRSIKDFKAEYPVQTLRYAVCIFFILLFSQWTQATDTIAYSLRSAQRMLENKEEIPGELFNVGSMTCLAGLVIDSKADDVILVGQTIPHRPPITLDDVIVAMRAPLLHNQLPLVSIDRTQDTEKTKEQKVRFEGGIESTQFGQDFLNSDLLLKRLALGLLEARAEGLQSYFDAYCQDAINSTRDPNNSTLSRFWFISENPPMLAHDDGVVAIRKVRMQVQTEIMGAINNGKEVDYQNLKNVTDPIGAAFAENMTRNYWELAKSNPYLARLKTLFELATLFSGFSQLESSQKPDLDFWLKKYTVQKVHTDGTVPLLANKKRYGMADNQTMIVTVTGGITIKAIARRIKAGSVTALRDVVLQSRPGRAALTWAVPISEWNVPGLEHEAEAMGTTLPPSTLKLDEDQTIGFSLLSGKALGSATEQSSGYNQFLSLGTPSYSNRSFSDLSLSSSMQYSIPNKIGGVMFSNTARLEGLNGKAISSAYIDPTTGTPSLLIQGEQVDLKQEDVRKFITALWAVYYGTEDPGISIDPDESDPDKQKVRLIGNIADTHLAKVMLDADYYMKQCAIGKVRPQIREFKSVDQISIHKRTLVRSAQRRFWFIPDEMSFSLCDNGLLFTGGRMQLKTEYVELGNKATEAEAADLDFAEFWTRHYWDFADTNPIYDELFEYARLTALAKFLKQQNVGLQSFLLMNRYLILSDNIPQEVPTLRSPSQYLFGTKWVGGVNLSTDLSERQERLINRDTRSSNILQKALVNLSTTKQLNIKGDDNKNSNEDKPVMARLPEQTYEIIPGAISSTLVSSGKPVCHTDFQLRVNGQPGVELVRYHRPDQLGIWGKGWDLLKPYSIRPIPGPRVSLRDVPVVLDDDRIINIAITVPQKIEVIDHIQQKSEIVSLEEKAFDTISWVPENQKKSLIRGLTPMKTGDFLLVEKTGCRFTFNNKGQLSGIIFSKDHAVKYHYQNNMVVKISDSLGGGVSLVYDHRYQRVKEAFTANGDFRAEYIYDRTNNELMMIRFSDNRILALIYNPTGELAEVVCKIKNENQNLVSALFGYDLN